MEISHLSVDSKSQTSGGARSRGSAVLQRAREYNRIIDENKSRSKSVDRKILACDESRQHHQKRSLSNPRTPRALTVDASSSTSHRDRALISVQSSHNTLSNSKSMGDKSHHPIVKETPVRNMRTTSRNTATTAHNSSLSPTATSSNKENNFRSPSTKESANPEQEQQAIVTPELLVDALSGHEDGLLAIAERLMEHYDSGYDVMGEAIIDAFADVQKLFQHVVEAAHMEGAAYEAGRKEEEIVKLKQSLENVGACCENDAGMLLSGTVNTPSSKNCSPSSGPIRHEEFIDQDVRDVLMDAIRKGQGLKDVKQHMDCYQLFEQACNSASALLPVDSDHRGRLQLSIARAESMNPERACAILKYVMDDVLRSGLNANSKVVMPDPSKRGDCVLSRPTPTSRCGDDHSGGGGTSRLSNTIMSTEDGAVMQSGEEALASVVEEMKEIVSAPVYDNSPLQSVAERFWGALAEAQRVNAKNEERLEQKVGTLKVDFLLAREEWEDKHNALSREYETFKKNIENAKHSDYMEQAKQGMSAIGKDYYGDGNGFSHQETPSNNYGSPSRNKPGSSVGSFASLSHHARSFVGSFSCTGGNHQTMSNKEVRERKGIRGKSARYQNDASPPPSVAGTSGTSSAKKTISHNEFQSLNQRETNPNCRRGPRTEF